MILFLVTDALATVRTVGTPAYPTIQSALNASVAGDRVEVPAGTWVENLTMSRSGVTLNGQGGVSGTTRVEGRMTVSGGVSATVSRLALAPTGNAVALTVSAGANATLTDVDLTRGGVGSNSLVLVQGATLSLSFSRVHDAEVGAGIELTGTSTLTVADSEVSGLHQNPAVQGAPIFVDDDAATVNLLRSVFVGNDGDLASVVWFEPRNTAVSTLLVDGCEFYANGVTYAWAVIDGNARNGASRVRVVNSVFQDNIGFFTIAGQESYYPQGGRWDLDVGGNTFVSNEGFDVYTHPGVDVRLGNNLFVAATGTHAVWVGRVPRVLDYNLYFANADTVRGASTGPHDLFVDPEFVGFSDDEDWTNDDLRLSPGSPAIGAGHPAWPDPTTGGPRDLGAL